MKELSNLESFIRSAEAGSFSAAARRLGLTAAAVSRNVARLEGRLGLGIAFIATMNAVQHLRSGALVRLLPDWHADIGPISLYFSGRQQLPAKTRAFVDYMVDECRKRGLASLLRAE